MKNAYKLIIIFAGVILTSCSADHQNKIEGYVEGEYVYLSAPVAGYLTNLEITRGERVKIGKTIFSLEAEPETKALAEAEAHEKAARARMENLMEPRRVQEIASLEAQISAAETAAKLSESQLNRRKALAKKQFLSQDQLNEAQAVRDRDVAQLESLKQQMASFKASVGRKAEVATAEAELEAAHAAVEQRRWVVEKKSVIAPAEGEIFDTYYQAGEWVAVGQPVASLLPDSGRKLRFFVPETQIAKIKIGEKITAYCDGCGQPITATVNYISAQAEYTPPVIYAENNREKLVFRVEAAIATEQLNGIRPGLPVDIELSGG